MQLNVNLRPNEPPEKLKEDDWVCVEHNRANRTGEIASVISDDGPGGKINVFVHRLGQEIALRRDKVMPLVTPANFGMPVHGTEVTAEEVAPEEAKKKTETEMEACFKIGRMEAAELDGVEAYDNCGSDGEMRLRLYEVIAARGRHSLANSLAANDQLSERLVDCASRDLDKATGRFQNRLEAVRKRKRIAVEEASKAIKEPPAPAEPAEKKQKKQEPAKKPAAPPAAEVEPPRKKAKPDPKPEPALSSKAEGKKPAKPPAPAEPAEKKQKKQEPAKKPAPAKPAPKPKKVNKEAPAEEAAAPERSRQFKQLQVEVRNIITYATKQCQASMHTAESMEAQQALFVTLVRQQAEIKFKALEDWIKKLPPDEYTEMFNALKKTFVSKIFASYRA